MNEADVTGLHPTSHFLKVDRERDRIIGEKGDVGESTRDVETMWDVG